MDQTTFSFEPTANLSNDSDLGATDFSFDPDPEIDIRALLGLSAGDVSLNLDPRSTIPDGSVPPALLTLPAGDVSLNFDPGWTIPDDSVPLDLDALLAPPAGDISLSFGGPDGSMANGDYTQGFVQERHTHPDNSYLDPQLFQLEVISQADYNFGTRLAAYNQTVAAPPSMNVNESNIVDLTGLDDGLAAPTGMEAQVHQAVEDMEVGFIHDVACEGGIFPTVEDTRRTIAAALAKSKGYGASREKFMPVASFLAKMKRCLENPSVSHADFSPQLKFWTTQGFQLEGEVVYKKASTDQKGTPTPQHPVPAREDCHRILIAAHSAANHGGRDETQKALTAAGVGIFISKDFITKWIRLCPTCGKKNKSYAPRKKGTKGPCLNAGVRKPRAPPKAKRPVRQPSPTPKRAGTQSTAGVPLIPISSSPTELPRRYREEAYFSGEDLVIADPNIGDISMEVPSRDGPFMGNPSMEDPSMSDPNMSDPSMNNIGMEDFDIHVQAKEWGRWPRENILPELPDYGVEFPSGYADNNYV